MRELEFGNAVRLKMLFYMISMSPSICLEAVTLVVNSVGFLLSLLVWPLVFGLVTMLPVKGRP